MTLKMFNVYQTTFDIKKRNMNSKKFIVKNQMLYAEMKSPTEIFKYNISKNSDFLDYLYRQRIYIYANGKWQQSPFNDSIPWKIGKYKCLTFWKIPPN